MFRRTPAILLAITFDIILLGNVHMLSGLKSSKVEGFVVFGIRIMLVLETTFG